jgi:hypothetical protein
MNNSTGGKVGLLAEATIDSYNDDGTVNIRVPTNPGLSIANLPLAFSGPNGEFIGGYPSIGTSVSVSYGQGKYFISSFLPTTKVFNSSTRDLMSEFTPGRILLQTAKAANRILMDPNSGISLGISTANEQIDPRRSIWSQNLNTEMSFTSAHRSIKGVIQRDIKENSTRNVSSSILDSHEYSDSLSNIGMDPSTTISTATTGSNIRNLPLVENHEIIYEFQNLDNGIGYTTDDIETGLYVSKLLPDRPTQILRKDSRTDSFNLNLNNPNFLIEKIEGTGVDLYGNILDINREVLPIGRLSDYSLNKNSDKQDAFKKIRAEHRRAIAYHWELNSRKQTGDDDTMQAPDPTTTADYGRLKSRTFFDIDKEGQFKINISASSETGNVPLLTRYETASTYAANLGLISDPNQLIKEGNNRDILHQGFANFATISLKGTLDGYEAPTDIVLNQPINLGTAYHDIQKTILQHQNTGRDKLINYFGTNEIYLNTIDYVEKVVSDTVKVDGPDANAGGRSGSINFDGMIACSIGANTVDRQSLWIDTAGSIIGNYGRDKFGHSYCGTFDGDILIQVGSTGVIGDSRFSNENNAIKSGTFDLRIVTGDGQLHILRFDSKGCSVSTPGRMEFSSEQDMIFRSNGNLLLEAKNIICYPLNGQGRIIKRSGVSEI